MERKKERKKETKEGKLKNSDKYEDLYEDDVNYDTAIRKRAWERKKKNCKFERKERKRIKERNIRMKKRIEVRKAFRNIKNY